MIELIKNLEDFNFINFNKEKTIGHFVMLNHRVKDAGDDPDFTAKSAKKETKICYSYEDMYKLLDKMNVLHTYSEEYSKLILRIYVHINGFEMNKVRFEMAKLMIDALQYNKQSSNIYKLINHIHCIEETNNNKYLHIDVDNIKENDVEIVKDYIKKTIEYRKQNITLDELIVDEYPTITGYHFITKRFDKKFLKDILKFEQRNIEIGIDTSGFALVGIIK